MHKAPVDFVVGVDVGATKTLAGVVTMNGEILGRTKTKTPSEQSYRQVLSVIAACIEKAISDSNLPRSRIAAVGIGLAGLLDHETGVVKAEPNLGWESVPVKQALERELKLRVFLENDVNAGTLAEYQLGAGVGVKNLVGVFVGTGIGGGLIFDGRLYHGFGGVAGELGHIIVKTNGPRCGCGNRGCLEALASRTAIVRDLAKAIAKGRKSSLSKLIRNGDLRHIGSNTLATAFRDGDKLTMKIVKRSARYCGIGVASVLNLLNPEMVVLGGGVVEAFGSDYVEMVIKAARKQTFPATFQGIQIVPARLGDDAVLLGAACLARENIERLKG